MLSFLNLQPETFAFILGFLSATLFWWLAGRMRSLLPRILASIRQQIRAGRRRSQDKVDEYLRRETLRAAQQMHLAAPMFALDEVLVPPVLIAPPAAVTQPGAPGSETLTAQILPYLPDWPQLASHYPVPTLTLVEAIQNGVKVVVIGQPGCGKTVALADLASQLARKETALGAFADSAPLFLHVFDLDLESQPPDPLEVLIQAVTARSGVLLQRQVPAYVRSMAQEDRLVLLLDGFDELAPAQTQKITLFLESLADRYPGMRMVATSGADYLDGLTRLGFLPLSLAGWRQSQCQDFIQHWGRLWSAEIAPEITRRDPGAPQVEPLLLNSWLSAEWGIFSPLEWTLRVWGAYAGNLNCLTTLEAEDAYVRRVIGATIPGEALARLAEKFLEQGQAGLPYNMLESVLAKFKLAPRPTTTGEQSSDPAKPQKKKTRQGEQVTSGGRILDILLDAGLLAEHAGGIIRLTSPVWIGLMASYATEEPAISLERPLWSAAASAARHLAARGKGQALAQSLLDGRDDLFQNRVLLAAGWLPTAPGDATWRPELMRRMLQLVQQESQPNAARARLVAAFACSNDPAIQLLFKQLLGSPSALLRRLAALGCGIIRSPKLVNDLTALMSDPNPDVRASACLALAAYGGKIAADILPQVLMHGEETLQLAAAEALSMDPPGQEILKGALEIDNLMVRRAAVLAFAQVRAPWALKLLEKVAVEDAQWVVRSAAGQAVENRQKPNPYSPVPTPQPSDAGWLVAFSGKQGVGVIPGHVPLDMLVLALQQGTLEEKLSALVYLKDYPDDAVVRAVNQAACSEPAQLREAAQYAQWYLRAGGVDLPASSLY